MNLTWTRKPRIWINGILIDALLFGLVMQKKPISAKVLRCLYGCQVTNWLVTWQIQRVNLSKILFKGFLKSFLRGGSHMAANLNSYLRIDGKYMIALATKCVRMCEANAERPAQTIQMFDITETNRLTS